MIKVHGQQVNNRRVIIMKDMQPLEIAQIVDHCDLKSGHVVMRTANSEIFEVIDLTAGKRNACWDMGMDIEVMLFNPDEPITITIQNEGR